MCPNDVPLRSCGNFKCDVADLKKSIRTDFRGVKCVSGECDQPYRETFHNISGPTVYYSKFLTSAPLHPIFNSMLAAATACESQARACEIEISLGIINCIFKEKHFLCIDQYLFQTKNI